MNQQPASPARPATDLVLHLLQALSADMGEVKADVREIKERIDFLEGQYASVSRRLDHIGRSVERIKMRLDPLNEGLS